MAQVAVIIPAAGRSTRFGGLEKKPFAPLDGRPVWQRSAELFWSRPDVTKVYLVVSPDDRDEFRQRFGHLLAFNNAQLVSGGAERFESVANALAVVPEEVELVAVHDAVRPLTPPALVDAVFAAAATHGAALLAVPLADTLKRVETGSTQVLETVPRGGLWQAQTPQVFCRDWLVDAYTRRTTLPGPITDDAQLVEAAGHPVHVVTGTALNFKITTQDDLALAETILRARNAKPVERPSRAFDDDAKW
ncbi:2-C-methyl-D-erythritol 4-phosphate cytidylyltransferase [Fimbriiglobus ruber]|uniref:2-C-methyl-D-erythritol 4-phosphate cytidylyltransferase n=1 Tax=Fimbriiglobus ruber TaxID=1908690 RepID=A0A225DPS2_9BACT|nr:2-C-methyl-D-erythritol 4-phosphate cytidylyltransferase [Fimbriiglobus ruber]OWK43301.1 2-C-methyl-D-erythritol 4-phosphate cytidylyltransferase [Fimbriiglobus ruber]